MSYTVLARKWRPKKFNELVGQTHVMQALANALDQGRLHHAYLFTGTRGVGKTTIARIFSKALNCEQGVSSQPCGVCSVCQSIDQGRFVDLIEVDAASKTKVEDTRELLDNVQYAPVQGRYKVYLIDEVHMLSKSSFNALLKTLEEPPEHVKFLLATTDPHKLPITVLSRCLQFNLMRLTLAQLQQHLSFILQQESIEFDSSALAILAKGADGSARDALSLLDQAIAYGAGRVEFTAVQSMLGLVDQHYAQAILLALQQRTPLELRRLMDDLALKGVDYFSLNRQLIELLHQVSRLQLVGGLGEAALLDEAQLQAFADSFSAEQLQIFYQMALLAQQDMGLAPDLRIAFEMLLLRMLAYQPVQQGEMVSSHPLPLNMDVSLEQSDPFMGTSQNTPIKGSPPTEEAAQSTLVATPPASETDANLASLKAKMNRLFSDEPIITSPEPASTASSEQKVLPQSAPEPKGLELISPIESEDLPQSNSACLPDIPPWVQEPLSDASAEASSPAQDGVSESMEAKEGTLNDLSVGAAKRQQEEAFKESEVQEVRLVGEGEQPASSDDCSDFVWIKALNLSGLALELANHCILIEQTPQRLILALDPQQLSVKVPLAEQRLQDAIQQVYGACQLQWSSMFPEGKITPAQAAQLAQQRAQSDAKRSIESDALVAHLVDEFKMRVIDSSIKPN